VLFVSFVATFFQTSKKVSHKGHKEHKGFQNLSVAMASHGFWWRKERALKIFAARKDSNG